MSQPDEERITSLESSVGARLAPHVAGGCLDAKALVELAVLGQKSPRYQAGIAHVVTCSSCSDLLRRFQVMERLEAAKGEPLYSRRPFSIFGPRMLAAYGVVLAAAAMLILVPHRTIVLLQDNGGQIRLTAAGDLSGLPGLPSTEKQSVASVLRSESVPAAAVLASLRPAFPRSADAFASTGPRVMVIDTLKPEFTWKMPRNAFSCRMTLLDETNPAHTVRPTPIKAETWTPKKPLARGEIYEWDVVALDKQGKEVAHVPSQAGTAKFKVLESGRSAELARERTSLGRSHLAMGAIYAQEGMLDDAVREFSALRDANPDSAVAKSLLESIQALKV